MQPSEYYIMLVDGRCSKITASNKIEAFAVAYDMFGYEDFDEFLNDVNLAEYKTETHRVVENYMSKESALFDVDTPYELDEYTKLNLSKYEVQDIEE